MKKFFYKKELSVHPYGDVILFVNSNDKERVAKEIKKICEREGEEFDKETESACLRGVGFFVAFPDTHYYVLTTFNVPETMVDYAIVAHEAFHVTYHILRRRGVTLSPESEEAFTYLQQYILLEYSRWVSKKHTKK